MEQFLTNLKRQAEENPLVALAALAGIMQSAGKLLSANSSRKNSKAWAREVNRRVAKQQAKK